MLKEYIANIIRKDYGFIEITAKNKKEAKKIALILEEQGEVIWNKNTMKITNINKKSKT